MPNSSFLVSDKNGHYYLWYSIIKKKLTSDPFFCLNIKPPLHTLRDFLSSPQLHPVAPLGLRIIPENGRHCKNNNKYSICNWTLAIESFWNMAITVEQVLSGYIRRVNKSNVPDCDLICVTQYGAEYAFAKNGNTFQLNQYYSIVVNIVSWYCTCHKHTFPNELTGETLDKKFEANPTLPQITVKRCEISQELPHEDVDFRC